MTAAMGGVLTVLLLGPDPSYPLSGAPIGGEWWVAIFAAMAAVLGALAATLLPRTVAVVMGALAPGAAIGILLLAKYLRAPAVPVVGDGFTAIPILFGVAGGAAAAGVSFAHGPAARAVAVLSTIALSLAATYGLTPFFGR